jgi:hypothetical protein
MKSNIQPCTARDWNPADPAGSFRRFAQFIHQQAKSVMVKDKFHSEMFFFMPLDGKGHIVLWRGDDRNRQAKWLRQHIAEHYSYGVVHICEAWVRLASGPNDHVLNQVIDGEMRVSELRPEDRIEAITVTAQSRDGYSHAWMDEVICNKALGIVVLGRSQECDDFEGRFGKLFG